MIDFQALEPRADGAETTLGKRESEIVRDDGRRLGDDYPDRSGPLIGRGPRDG